MFLFLLILSAFDFVSSPFFPFPFLFSLEFSRILISFSTSFLFNSFSTSLSVRSTILLLHTGCLFCFKGLGFRSERVRISLEASEETLKLRLDPLVEEASGFEGMDSGAFVTREEPDAAYFNLQKRDQKR